MPRNMGTADRTLRTILAILFLVLVLLGSVKGALSWLLIAVAAVFLVTSATGTCPAYMPLGIDTRGKAKRG